MSQVVYRERKGTNCVKFDGLKDKFGREDLLPLWIADMDFEAPKEVKDALREYVDFGVFGYYKVPDSYKEAFIRWEEKHHDYHVEKEWIRTAPGVVPGFSEIIRMLTKENDAIIIMTPVYYPFSNAIIYNNRTLVESPLIRTEDSYVIDFEDFERKIVDNDVKLFLLCSPHNPVGRVWSAKELRKMLDICKKHQVYVISDEIHQDILMQGQRSVAAAAVGEYDDILITIAAPSKTFNLAGCKNSILIMPNEAFRKQYDAFQTQFHVEVGNGFGYVATEAAYEHGEAWLSQVNAIIESNYQRMKERLESELPKVWIPKMEGTYLMWIDLGAYVTDGNLQDIMENKCRIAVDYGSWFGKDCEGFVRINLATRPENIDLAADRIIQALQEK